MKPKHYDQKVNEIIIQIKGEIKMSKEVLLPKTESESNGYSAYYLTIRTNAEKNWPLWRKVAYNRDFAVSTHAKKFEIGTKKP